jgi:hypothetical protein
MGVKVISAGAGAAAATVITRSADTGTFGLVGGVVDGGLLAGATSVNTARLTSIVGDGAEEVMIVNKGAGHGRPGEDTANSVQDNALDLGWEVTGDFEIKIRYQYDSENSNAMMGLAMWRWPATGLDNRYVYSGNSGFLDKHQVMVSMETLNHVDTAGAAVTETDFVWVKLKRDGALITAGWSTDDVTYTDTLAEGELDTAGNRCWVGVLAGMHTIQSTYTWNMSDFYLSYFPAV